MYWEIRCEKMDVAPEERGGPQDKAGDGRFVLHRHHDAAGPHLDLRLEQEDHLAGWRIDGTALEGTCWATEKMPHPKAWLEQDGEAVRADEGVYAWLERGPAGNVLELRGRRGSLCLWISPAAGLPAHAVRTVNEALRACEATPGDAAGLLRDGHEARVRAVTRLCGLGRELDGTAFDEITWRRTLAGLTLKEIGGHLEGFELRYDAKYPPLPVSKPEPLPETEGTAPASKVLEILQG